jgi:hypothetical protein
MQRKTERLQKGMVDEKKEATIRKFFDMNVPQKRRINLDNVISYYPQDRFIVFDTTAGLATVKIEFNNIDDMLAALGRLDDYLTQKL